MQKEEDPGPQPVDPPSLCEFQGLVKHPSAFQSSPLGLFFLCVPGVHVTGSEGWSLGKGLLEFLRQELEPGGLLEEGRRAVKRG